MEVFKDILGYEGLYQVSNLGRVKSLPKGNGNGNRERFLKQEAITRKSQTYLRVTMSKHGKTTRAFVHRLVAIAFMQNPDNKPFINHIDNNSENNCLENLEWCTQKENMQHSVKQGRQELVQKMATDAAKIANIQKAKTKYDSMIDTNINGRILLEYFKDSKDKYKGKFQCTNCTNKFEANLDESIRRAKRDKPTHCRSCMRKIKLEDIV